jgi:hypothetical protein
MIRGIVSHEEVVFALKNKRAALFHVRSAAMKKAARTRKKQAALRREAEAARAEEKQGEAAWMPEFPADRDRDERLCAPCAQMLGAKMPRTILPMYPTLCCVCCRPDDRRVPCRHVGEYDWPTPKPMKQLSLLGDAA